MPKGGSVSDSIEALIDVLQPSRLSAVVDIGANPIDGDPPYKSMLVRELCKLVAFEPQPDALALLTASAGAHETYLPLAVGDGREHILRVTRASGMTSLLEPDRDRLALFNGFSEWGSVLKRVPVRTTRLDDVPQVRDMDYLKIDIQGGELMVFQNAVEKLSKAVMVHTEVSFVPLYEEQPTFGDIDLELRRQGFIPHALAALKRWPIAPVIYGGDFRIAKNQLLEADMVYVRDFRYSDQLSDDQLVNLAILADAVYGSTDLACHCLTLLAQRGAIAIEAPGNYLSIL